MKTIYFIAISIFLLSNCNTNNHYDKGKEFTILEDSITTAFSALNFETNESCKECHPIIYEEFTTSMHYKSTVFRDPIHNAVWEDHPNYKDKSQYKCAQCHIPGADNIAEFMNKGGQAMPDKTNDSQNEGVSCASCHKIKSIEKHRQANRNIYNRTDEQYYGIGEQLSIAHLTNSKNEMYRTGEMCMGCHSHRENIENYIVCITEDQTKGKSYETCITCHMPQTDGPSSTNATRKKHFYHGFAGVHNDQDMLAKHVEFSVEKLSKNEFKFRIKNKSPHDLFPHPLRRSFLKMSIIREGKKIHDFETMAMERVMENNDGTAGCTLATKETKSNIIKGDKTSVLQFKFELKANDKFEVEYGYHLVKAEMLKELGLENNKEASEYKIFKKEQILIE